MSVRFRTVGGPEPERAQDIEPPTDPGEVVFFRNANDFGRWWSMDHTGLPGMRKATGEEAMSVAVAALRL